VLVEGVKIGLAIGETNAFKKLGTKFWDQIPMPGRLNVDLFPSYASTTIPVTYKSVMLYQHLQGQ
jgi:hypothetical protein